MAVQQSMGDAARQHQAHEQAIEMLAKETQMDVSYVRGLYYNERARLESQATIKTYLSVIATRLVRDTLIKSQHSTIQ